MSLFVQPPMNQNTFSSIAQDTRILIERYKSGDVPPGDFKFEDMSDPQAMLAQDALEKPTNLNLYQRKREIEAEIKVGYIEKET